MHATVIMSQCTSQINDVISSYCLTISFVCLSYLVCSHSLSLQRIRKKTAQRKSAATNVKLTEVYPLKVSKSNEAKGGKVVATIIISIWFVSIDLEIEFYLTDLQTVRGVKTFSPVQTAVLQGKWSSLCTFTCSQKSSYGHSLTEVCGLRYNR